MSARPTDRFLLCFSWKNLGVNGDETLVNSRKDFEKNVTKTIVKEYKNFL